MLSCSERLYILKRPIDQDDLFFPLGINILDFPGPIHKQLVHAVCIHTALADCVESTTNMSAALSDQVIPGLVLQIPKIRRLPIFQKAIALHMYEVQAPKYPSNLKGIVFTPCFCKPRMKPLEDKELEHI